MLRKNNFSLFTLIGITAVVSIGAALSGCGGGGGGGGGSFTGAARINMTASPRTIDTDDRTQVTIKIRDVIDSGVVLKIRYPDKLSFVAKTAKLKIDSEDVSLPVEPNFTGERNSNKYLVFLLPREAFGDFSDDEEIASEPGTLTLQLVGNARLRDGRIEADADVNDPSTPDNEEFDINNPKFEVETEASIEVTQSRD